MCYFIMIFIYNNHAKLVLFFHELKKTIFDNRQDGSYLIDFKR